MQQENRGVPPTPKVSQGESLAEHYQRSVGFFRLTVAFMLLVVLFIIALEVWRINRDYDQAFATAGDSATNLTRAAAQHAEDAVRQVDTLLAGVRERVEGDGLSQLNRPRLQSLFIQQIALLPQLHSLALYDAQGHWLVRDTPAADTLNAGNADRDYFLYHKTHTDRGLHIGQVVANRISGDLVIPLSRRINNPDGSFAGVFLGTLDLRYFSNYYADFKIDDNGVFVLALRDGTILVRRPALEGATGQSVASGEIFKSYLPHANEGIVEMASRVDNVPRLYGYKLVSNYPLVVEAGISQRSIVAGWRRDFIKSAGVVTVLLGGLSLFGAVVLRQLRYRIGMEEELRQAHLTVQEMALRDSLTGLGNRRKLDMVLAEEIQRARRSGFPLGLIMLDIDYFKRYNDHYGHPAGDECLRRVAIAVQGTLRRAGDLAVRYGGEELTVVLPNTDARGASLIAEYILRAIRALQIEHADSPAGYVTASAGVHVSSCAAPELGPAALIKSADAVLYLAKHSGRDRWRIAEAAHSPEDEVVQ